MQTVLIFLIFITQFWDSTHLTASERSTIHHQARLSSIECSVLKVKTDPLILVVGCGRSGTKYMAKFLQASGLDVGHEKMGKDGSVSWLMSAIIDWAPWGPLSKDFHFRHIFHQVRNPVKMIQSFYNIPPLATWEWISEVIPEIKPSDSVLTKSAKYWLYWNLMSEKRAEWTYRIENFDKEYKEMGRRLGITFNEQTLQSISKKTNAKNNSIRLLSWKILRDELEPQLLNDIRKLALRYGYEVPPEAY